MTKRVVAGVLWFFTVAYAWNFISAFLGISQTPGLLLGATAGLLFAADPLRRIWAARRVAVQPLDAERVPAGA